MTLPVMAPHVAGEAVWGTAVARRRILLGRLLGQLALPDVGALDRATVTTIKATKAARARRSKGAS